MDQTKGPRVQATMENRTGPAGVEQERRTLVVGYDDAGQVLGGRPAGTVKDYMVTRRKHQRARARRLGVRFEERVEPAPPALFTQIPELLEIAECREHLRLVGLGRPGKCWIMVANVEADPDDVPAPLVWLGSGTVRPARIPVSDKDKLRDWGKATSRLKADGVTRNDQRTVDPMAT